MSELTQILVESYVIVCEGVPDNKYEFNSFEKADDALYKLREKHQNLNFELWAKIDA